MSNRKRAESLFVAVNSTEWRNLCARGSIRLLSSRPINTAPMPDANDSHRLFAAAPVTKIDSSIDLLVLELIPNWRTVAEQHPSNEHVCILRLEHVLRHHLVSDEHMNYYSVEASKMSIDIEGAKFEALWRDWVEAESTSAAVEAAGLLYLRFRPPSLSDNPGLTHHETFQITDYLAQISLSEASENHVGTILRGAAHIDDAISNVRTSESALVASCVEWIDHRLGIDVYSTNPVGIIIRNSIASVKPNELPAIKDVSPTTDAAIGLLEASFPDAFSKELTGRTVLALTTLIAGCRFGDAKPDLFGRILFELGTLGPDSLLLASAVTAKLIGPELSRQLLRLEGRPNPITSSQGD